MRPAGICGTGTGVAAGTGVTAGSDAEAGVGSTAAGAGVTVTEYENPEGLTELTYSEDTKPVFPSAVHFVQPPEAGPARTCVPFLNIVMME